MLPELYKTIETKEEEKRYEKAVTKTETAYNHTRLLPAGRHYFYFIRQARYFCLSDRYPVAKFKGTNLYMNEIHVSPRTWRIQDFDLGEVLGIRQKLKFDISKSIFRSFKVENEEYLRKAFELDFKYTKIKKIFKSNVNECENVKNLLWKHYEKIKNIYLTNMLGSDYPVVSWNDFTLFCNKCKIPDKTCNLATIDRIFIATNVSTNGSKGSRDQERYEFLEILVRLANNKYKDTGLAPSASEALRKLLEDNVFPNIEETV